MGRLQSLKNGVGGFFVARSEVAAALREAAGEVAFVWAHFQLVAKPKNALDEQILSFGLAGALDGIQGMPVARAGQVGGPVCRDSSRSPVLPSLRRPRYLRSDCKGKGAALPAASAVARRPGQAHPQCRYAGIRALETSLGP